ncbi:hypothetical protein ACNPNP_11070 [Microbacterium sp. AGC85]
METTGRAWLEKIVEADAHHGTVGFAADTVATDSHAFSGLVSRRHPPGFQDSQMASSTTRITMRR